MSNRVLDPLRTAERIGESYRNYLVSTFRPRSAEFEAEFEAAISSAKLTQGPYLEASAPFETGASVADLIDEGVLSPLFRRLQPDVFPIDRPLYRHQEIAIRKAVRGRNLVVSTGTGSGKTEAFLIPVLNGLLREIEVGRIGAPGVRALLLYPMNALANDQVKRLRRLLEPFPEVTFGRYVGETKHSELQAEDDFRARYPREPRVRNELLSREVMQATPPSILLTNYAMLEYLLLRPDDSSFFDGPTGEHWRAIVLDEAHVYDGATGVEVAMLMRRVRDRVVGSETGRLQCFATSATLGRGAQDRPRMVAFAEALFGERFELDDEDDDRVDVVEAIRRPLVIAEAGHAIPGEVFVALDEAFRAGADPAELAALVASHVDGAAPSPDETPSAYLGRVLAGDRSVIAVQEALGEGAVELGELAAELLGGTDGERQLVALIDLGVAARRSDADAALIPARYHFWVSSLEGGFVCLHPRHPVDAPRLVLGRHEHCPACAAAGRRSYMVEIGVCRSCGAEYAVGDLEATGDGYRLVPVSDWKVTPEYFLFEGEAIEADEDVVAQDVGGDLQSLDQWFDVGTGLVGSGDPRASATAVRMMQVARPKLDEPLHRCGRCSTSVSGEVVFRLLTGTDAPVSVVATELYQALPPSSDPDQRLEAGEGRKLLSFADSRQDAAYFAPYLERTYLRSITRGLIWKAAEELTSRGGTPRLSDVAHDVLRAAEDALVLDPDDGRTANRREVDSWLVQEAMAWDRRLSIDGLGLAEIRVAIPRRFRIPAALAEVGFDDDEARTIVTVLLDTMRLNGAITMPDGVDIRDERFAPRNREIRFRAEIAEPGIAAWLPGGSAKNRRLEYMEKLLAARGVDADARAVLKSLWHELTDPDGIWASVLVESSDKRTGVGWRVAFDRIEIQPLSAVHRPHRCDTCRRVWWWSVDGVCPGWRCPGRLAEIDDTAELERNHYARLYRALDPLAMAVKEHTAQWKAAVASRIQDDFMAGRLNVLSCSTTFELGVDVGEVQAVLLRNVPPRAANYVQRAGRAGRRQDSAALVVTVAQRRAHDRYHFADPRPMIEGSVDPPLIELENEPITRRHMHSVAFAAFERHLVDRGGKPHRTVEDFFKPATGRSGADEMRRWFESHPPELAAQLRRVLPGDMAERLGVDDWSWVHALYEESDDEPSFGWLGRAADEVREELEDLEAQIDVAFGERKGGLGEYYKRVRQTLAGRYLLGFLASRNVLPKYGFPVDVVPLSLQAKGSPEADDLELDRDLRLAIGDYAPGATVVAGGYLWRSEGLRRQASREWPVYKWRVCRDCGAFRSRLGDVSKACPECGCDGSPMNGGGSYLLPIFGFVGVHAGKPGDSRPPRRRRVRSWFASYRSSPPDFERVDELSSVVPVERRTSRQGRIVTINDGAGGGFRICRDCGRGLEPPKKGQRASREHDRLGRPGRKCKGSFISAGLGHDYLTDVMEIRIGGPKRRSAAVSPSRSMLYALLAGVTELGVSRGDVDGTLHTSAGGQPALVIFDTVAGGAGHAQYLGSRLPELFRAALEVVSQCDCEVTSSCYGCLRTYDNQFHHEELSRGDARDLLRYILGESSGGDGLDEFHPVVHRLVGAAVEAGAELPVPGYETGTGDPVEAAWPEQKVAVWIERGDEVPDKRTPWFRQDGWQARHVNDWTEAELLDALGVV